MPPSFVSLIHLGCARNLIDSELMLGRLAEQGLVVTGDQEMAHTVVLNTCSFIGPAREESEGAIRELLERKQRGELQGVVVAGCLVERYKHELQQRFPGVDVWAEISDYTALASSVRGLVDGKQHAAYLAAPAARGAEREGARLLATPDSYAYLRISHGCDHSCSFCAIPTIRGAHRSKSLAAVTQEAQELISCGVRELVLVAEDSTAWGRDSGAQLPQLVEALAELDGDHRLRLMYAYPNRFPWELTALLRDHPRVLPYLDIPVQHAATSVLRGMGRAGSGDQVRRIFDRLLEEVPGITLRTTCLLGFPGETDEDAAELVRFVEEYRLGRLGAFTYSPEQGTPGYELEGRIDAALAEERRTLVLQARDRVLVQDQAALVGTELQVLVDEPPGEDGSQLARGAADAPEVDLLTIILDGDFAVGEDAPVRVEAIDEEYNLIARAVSA